MSKSLKEHIDELIDGNLADAPTVSFRGLRFKYANLILDEMPICKITAEDKQYLDENFTGCERLCLNECKLSSLDNLPAVQSIFRVRRLCSLAAGVERQRAGRRGGGEAAGHVPADRAQALQQQGRQAGDLREVGE